jgi:DNA invertase Pin-like site-specific DNA recombinase
MHMPDKVYRAAKYIRLSVRNIRDPADAGGERSSHEFESDSIVNQRKLLDSYIEGQPDIEAVAEYVDDGVSGIIFDREQFKLMMADIKAGKIDCVIVKDLSRLGREYIETGRYLRRIFPAYGVRFIALGDNIDTLKDSGDDLVVSVKSILNDAYCRDISVKTRAALNVKRDNGDYVGACPVYGYKKSDGDNNLLVIDEYPASIVRDIYRMKIDGMSALKISETLNALGVLSPHMYKMDRGLPHPKNGYADRADAKWSATTVIRILSDETYTGTLIQGRQGTINYKIKDLIDKPESEWRRIPDTHEAIISRYEFGLAARVMRLDTRAAPGKGSVYLFSGILVCGCCGERMTRKSVPYKDTKYHYYYCPTTKKRGCHDAPTVKESELTECVLESVKGHIRNIASLDAVLSGDGAQKALEVLSRQYAEQIADNERQLEKIIGFKTSLYENMVGGILSKEDYKSLKAKYAADETRLLGAIGVLKSQRDDVMSGKSERLKWAEHFKRFENLSELDRRAVVNLIHSIRVTSKTQLHITFSFQSEYDAALALIDDMGGNWEEVA